MKMHHMHHIMHQTDKIIDHMDKIKYKDNN